MDNIISSFLQGWLPNYALGILLHAAALVLAVIYRKRLPTAFVYIIIGSALYLLLCVLSGVNFYVYVSSHSRGVIPNILSTAINGLSFIGFLLAAFSPILPASLKFGTDKYRAPASNWTPPPPPF